MSDGKLVLKSGKTIFIERGQTSPGPATHSDGRAELTGATTSHDFQYGFSNVKHCVKCGMEAKGSGEPMNPCPGRYPDSDGRAKSVAMSGRAIVEEIKADAPSYVNFGKRRFVFDAEKLSAEDRAMLVKSFMDSKRDTIVFIDGRSPFQAEIIPKPEPDYDAILLAARKRREEGNDEPVGGWNPKAAYMQSWNANREFHNSHSLKRAMSLDPTDVPAIRRAMVGGVP